MDLAVQAKLEAERESAYAKELLKEYNVQHCPVCGSLTCLGAEFPEGCPVSITQDSLLQASAKAAVRRRKSSKASSVEQAIANLLGGNRNGSNF